MNLVLTIDGKPRSGHKRKYNLPVVNEVALLDMTETLHPLDVVINIREGGRQFISERHPQFDQLHYVLLFPHGDEGLGWHCNMRQTNGPNRMTAVMYYKHLFQFREGQFNLIVRSAKLFMEFCCVAWYKANKQRLK